MIEITGNFIAKTAAAYYVEVGRKRHWIPKSVTKGISIEAENPLKQRPCKLQVEPWFLKKNNILH